MFAHVMKLLLSGDNFKVFIYSLKEDLYRIKDIRKNFKYKLRDYLGWMWYIALPKFSASLSCHHLQRIIYSAYHIMPYYVY